MIKTACAAGPLRSAGITPLLRYYGPGRHRLAFDRFPGFAGYTAYLHKHGLRIPTQFNNSTPGPFDALYALSEQQAPVGTSSGTLSIMFAKKAGVSWFNTSGPVATVLNNSTVTRLEQLASAINVKIQPMLASYLQVRPKSYALEHSISVVADSGAGEQEIQRVWALPDTLRADVRSSIDQLRVELKQRPSGDPARDGVAPVQPIPYARFNTRWTIAVPITVRQVPDIGHIGVPPNIYVLGGTDESSRTLIEQLLASPALASASLQLLHRAKTQNALISDASGHDVVIVKLNLSPATEPGILLARASAEPVRADLDPTNVSDFLVLIDQCSIVHAGGFYLYHPKLAWLFAGQPKKDGERLTLLIALDPVDKTGVPVCDPLYNSIVLDSKAGAPTPDQSTNIDTSVFYAEAAELQAYAPAVKPGCFPFSILRVDPGATYVLPKGGTGTRAQLVAQLHDLGIGDENSQAFRDALIRAGADRVALETLFNLLVHQVRNLGGFNSSSVSAPFGPHPVDSPDTWEYRQTVPAWKFLPSNDNPYAVVGKTVTLDFALRDVFGNELSPQQLKPTSKDFSLQYFDRLLPISEWPGVSSSYDFSKDSPNVLNITFRFDPSGFKDDTARMAAQQCLGLIKQQLAAMGIEISVATSLANREFPLTPEQIQKLIGFVQTCHDNVNGKMDVPPATFDFPIPADAITSKDIFELTVVWHTRRKAQLVDPDVLKNYPAAADAATAISPNRTSAGVPTAADFREFAKNFEQNFSLMFKLAAAPARLDSSDDAGSAIGPLWGIRKSVLNVTFSGPEQFYAPRPVSTSLWSGRVVIPEVGGGSLAEQVADIDLDQYLQYFLQSLEEFLSPERVFARQSDKFVFPPDKFQRLMMCKRTIADKLKLMVDDLPQKQADPKGLDAARQQLGDRVLASLRSFYGIDSIVQFPLTVNAPATNRKESFFLYGNIKTPNQANPSFSFLPGKIMLGDKPGQSSASYLTVLVTQQPTATRQLQQDSLPQLNLQFQVTHLERRPPALPTEYAPSSWLMFFIPFAIPDTAIAAGAPIPLRRYPPAAAISNAAGIPGLPIPNCSNKPGPPPPPSIANAKQWQYTFHFERQYFPQDQVIAQLQYNINPTVLAVGVDDLPVALVAFQRKYAVLAVTALSDPRALDLLVVLTEQVATATPLGKTQFPSDAPEDYLIDTVKLTITPPPNAKASPLRICPQGAGFEVGFGFEDVSNISSVWGGIFIQRNAEILGKGVPVNSQFVYITPVVRFGAPSTPLLVENRIIDLAPGGQIGTLKEHLARLFQSLFPLPISSDRGLQVRLRARYAFDHRDHPTDRAFEVITPISFWPSSLIDTSTTVPKLIDDLAATLTSWCKTNSAREGLLTFDLALFAASSGQPLPVLQLKQLRLQMNQIL